MRRRISKTFRIGAGYAETEYAVLGVDLLEHFAGTEFNNPRASFRIQRPKPPGRPNPGPDLASCIDPSHNTPFFLSWPENMVASHGGVEEPPPFNLTDIDRAVLASTDEEFHLQTWEDLKTIIGTAPPTNHYCPTSHTIQIWN
jgi:hypothetical protein